LNLIGNKSEFAVEFRITDLSNMMGYGKLWICDEFYGTNQDLIYLVGYLQNLMENILEVETVSFIESQLSNEEIYQQLKSLSNETSEYQITSSTFTNDFNGYKFREDQNIVLVWKLRDDIEMIFDDLKDYKKSVVLVRVNSQTINEVLNKFKDEIKKARA
jgi:hypothetical protein